MQEDGESSDLHYVVRVSVSIECREYPRSIQATYGTEYVCGDLGMSREKLIRKCMKKAFAERREI